MPAEADLAPEPAFVPEAFAEAPAQSSIAPFLTPAEASVFAPETVKTGPGDGTPAETAVFREEAEENEVEEALDIEPEESLFTASEDATDSDEPTDSETK